MAELLFQSGTGDGGLPKSALAMLSWGNPHVPVMLGSTEHVRAER
jgi:hypothetical protein